MEKDPTGRQAHEPGAKLDDGKLLASLLQDFSLALAEVAKVCTHGAKKYSRGGWQFVPDAIERYDDAKWRHLLANRHEEFDRDSGLLHQAHEAWNILAMLELKLRGTTSSNPVSVPHLDDGVCGRCSTVVGEDDIFCRHCGNDL